MDPCSISVSISNSELSLNNTTCLCIKDSCE